MGKYNFTHLHVHTQYSLLDGASKITDLVKKAKDLGMTSLAITDHGVMYGVIDFYKECKKEGIKPILGVEAYVINGDILDKDSGRAEERYHLILLAENNEGYKNLMKLVSISHKDGFYYKPRMNKEMLRKYHEGIICLSACLSGEVQDNILKRDYDEADKRALEYKEIFGENNFFLEMQASPIPEQIEVNSVLCDMSKRLNIPLVVTNDIHYVESEDSKVQEILLCIQTGKKLSDDDRMKMSSNTYYFKTEEEMAEYFSDNLDALTNAKLIADRCNVEIEFGKYKLPKYKIETGETSFEFLKRLCYEGIDKYFKDETSDEKKKLIERIDYELSVISSMGFVDYFLIVWDFIKFAKDHDIPVGPGRGSAAGSLVSYALNITEVNPIKYNLLFERFLNPERVTMPDIDVDFCTQRRGEVIDYVTEKYGADCVSQIVTFGTMAAKQVIRDVGRVLDMPYQDVDQIAKAIPYEMHMTIEKALEINKDLKDLYLTNEDVRFLIDTAKKLEGLPRHASTHAAGVVITDKPIYEYVPLSKSEDFVVTQFNMTTIEELGLLKMDFLGLRNLSVIKDTLVQIENNYGKKIDLLNIDMNDKEVYKMISEGKTEGVFQLESKGMTQFMKMLKPERLEDIIAGISLYRPGPMDMIPKYIQGKVDPDSITYDCDEVRDILSDTNGVMVYQEQVMQILQKLAGYSLGQSDLIRRAMSKKKMDVMIKEKETFVNGDKERGILGAVNNGISKEVAESIFDKMIDFANYAFNKSHSAAYSFVAYETAFLKRYYPAEFYSALMSSVMTSQEQVSQYILSARNLGIKVNAPDINTSSFAFSAKDGEINYALSAVKGIGFDIIEKMAKERDDNGKFLSLTDFIERMIKYNISRKAIENLIKVGAFDSLGGRRSQYLAIYLILYDKLLDKYKRQMDGQLDLFSLGMEEDEVIKDEFPNLDELDSNIKLMMEKELLGVYVSGHPLDSYKKTIEQKTNTTISKIKEKSEADEYLVKDNEEVIIAGLINSLNLKMTKTGSMMAFSEILDMTGEIELVIFPKTFERYKNAIAEENVVLVRGRVNLREEEVTILASEIALLEEKDVKAALTLTIESVKDKNMLSNMEKILSKYPGQSLIEIYSLDDKKSRNPKLKVRVCDELKKELGFLLGEKNVEINY